MVFICSPGPTVVGLLSRSLRTVPEVQGLSPGGDIVHLELVRKGEEKGRAEIGRMPKEMLDLILTRRPGQPWGFTLAGGRDKGQSLKVGLGVILPVMK